MIKTIISTLLKPCFAHVLARGGRVGAHCDREINTNAASFQFNAIGLLLLIAAIKGILSNMKARAYSGLVSIIFMIKSHESESSGAIILEAAIIIS